MKKNTIGNKLNALERILKNCHVPASNYSMGEYSDECVCVEGSDNSWEVYLACRGTKRDLKRYNKFYNAATDVVERVVGSKYRSQAMRDINVFQGQVRTVVSYPIQRIGKPSKNIPIKNTNRTIPAQVRYIYCKRNTNGIVSKIPKGEK